MSTSGVVRVCVVGGRERNAGEVERAARARGLCVEIHRGDVHGRAAEAIEASVMRADVVVVVTEINSHGGLLVARKAARRAGVRVQYARRLSPSLLDEIAA